ncbi:MAG: XisI protein [Candidatus Poribacteria bacterium]|nr:XisI protein [Candidatus Poribacteria bacterium]
MDRVEEYRQIILNIFQEYVQIPYAHGDMKDEIIVDREADRYLLMISGWDDGSRIHACLARVDIIDGKLWIQYDNTEDGIATDLERYGVPKEHIVLGFRSPEVRKYTGYAAT